MSRISKIIIFSLVLFLGAFIYINNTEFAWADACNTGGTGHDSSCGGADGGGGGSCPNNSCGSVVYSGATGVVEVTVTEQTKNVGIHVPSVCTNSKCSSFNYTPEQNTIKTGDAEIGSTYYLAAMYADADGYVYVDGQKQYFTKGQVITYIPFSGLPGAGGNLWGVANSRRDYGSISYQEAMNIYHQMLPFLNKELKISDLTGFGGLLKKIGLKEEDLCELISCDDDHVETPPISSCHVGSHAGWTEGRVQVNNLTKGTGWTGEVWARPGDTVRFSMYYCWGVGAVAGSANNDPSSPWAINPGGNAIAYGSAVQNVWFNISGSPNNNYLFGFDERTIRDTGPRHVLNNPHAKNIGSADPSLAGIDGHDLSDGDYDFLYLSPSEEGVDADSYNCSIFDFSGYTLGGSHGYQIPGVGTGSCGAISGNGGNMSDAGSTFSQTITYSYDTAWQRFRHNETGDCGNGTCTHQPENPPAPQESKPVHEDKELNTLKERNSNTSGTPYKTLQAALGAGVNDWGLVKKHDGNTTTTFNETLPGDCDSNGCGASNWRAYPHWGCTCGCKKCGTCDLCPCGRDEAGVCQCNEEHHIEDCDACGCSECEKGPCWGSWFSGNSQEASDKPGKSFHKPEKDYSTGQQQLGSSSSTATVKVPYSYKTSTTSGLQEGEVIYTGETVTSSFTASILPRIVSEVRSGEAYATVVPGYIKAVEFVVGADSSLNPASGSNNAGGSDPCSFYGSLGMISGCNTIWEEHGAGGYLNEEGRYGGKTYSHSETRVVPDIYPIGSKYCVAVGISTSDSHNQPEAFTVSGMSNISGWRISGLSCRTIAKKPNFQVWNGGFYTNGGIKTSNSIKRVSAKLGDSADPTGYFGSWTEYYVTAGLATKGFSSGAGLGYEGWKGKSLGLQGGTAPGTSYCDLTRMTIANSNCSSNNGGAGYYAGNSGITVSAESLLQRIYSRYLGSEKESIIKSLDNGATYVYSKGNIKASELYNITKNIELQNTVLSASEIRQRKSSIDLESEQTTKNYASNTLVIHVNGTFTIDRDICTGDGTCGSDTNLILAKRNSDTYNNIYSLPQIIIVAKKGIVITSNVTQIDAWVITNGNINTCDGKNPIGGNVSASECSNQLIINGPVFANSLTLARNAGADGGPGKGNSGNPINFNLSDDGSIQPAEIFNLRPDALLWAYSQAQRYSQANVTYTREIAPRY